MRSSRLTPFVVAAASAATMLVAPLAHADEAAAAPQTCTPHNVVTTGGTFYWAYKESFLQHLKEMPIARGEVTAGDGATLESAKGPFAFPLQSGTKGWFNTAGTDIATKGYASMRGYPGLSTTGKWGMENKLSDIRLKITAPGKGEIIADYDTNQLKDGLGGDAIHRDDAVFATFTFDADLATAKKQQNVKLKVVAAEGASEFSAHKYAVGTELAPAVLFINNTGDCLAGDEKPEPPVVGDGSFATYLPLGIFAAVAALLGALAGLFNWAVQTGIVKMP